MTWLRALNLAARRLAAGLLFLALPPCAAWAQASDPVLLAAGVREGPPSIEFWANVPRVVPAGAKRGDIYWMRRHPEQPASGDQAWRMAYVTEGVGGKLVYAVGEIYIPKTASAGARKVALWNHGSGGTENSCAPSMQRETTAPLNARGQQRALAPGELLRRGYVLVMSDYQGLGTPGGTPYPDNDLAAKASLDAVRAARNFAPAQAGSRLVDYGRSQGAAVAIWIAKIAKTYTPELEVLGGVAQAPAIDRLGLQLEHMKVPAMGAYIVAEAAGTVVSHPELRLRDLLTIHGLELLATLQDGCADTFAATRNDTEAVVRPEALAPGQPWRKALDADDDLSGMPSNSPLLIIQGDKDVDVPPILTRGVVDNLCAQGALVDYREYQGLDHFTAAYPIWEVVPGWFDARFAGERAGRTCPRQTAAPYTIPTAAPFPP